MFNVTNLHLLSIFLSIRLSFICNFYFLDYQLLLDSFSTFLNQLKYLFFIVLTAFDTIKKKEYLTVEHNRLQRFNLFRLSKCHNIINSNSNSKSNNININVNGNNNNA